MKRFNIKTCRAGFTLIEVMVAMVILSILVVMIGNIFQQVSNSWNIGTQSAEANTAGRAALNFIAQELSHAVAGPIESAPGTAAHNPDLTFDVINGDELRFVTLTGVPAYDATNPRESLRRVAVYFTGNEYRLMYARQTQTNNAYTHSPSKAGASLLITNVVGFRVSVYETRDDMVTDNPVSQPLVTNQLPLCVDLCLELMSDGNMQRWKSLGGVSADEFRDRHAQVYSTRVYFLNRRGYAAP